MQPVIHEFNGNHRSKTKKFSLKKTINKLMGKGASFLQVRLHFGMPYRMYQIVNVVMYRVGLQFQLQYKRNDQLFF